MQADFGITATPVDSPICVTFFKDQELAVGCAREVADFLANLGLLSSNDRSRLDNPQGVKDFQLALRFIRTNALIQVVDDSVNTVSGDYLPMLTRVWKDLTFHQIKSLSFVTRKTVGYLETYRELQTNFELLTVAQIGVNAINRHISDLQTRPLRCRSDEEVVQRLADEVGDYFESNHAQLKNLSIYLSDKERRCLSSGLRTPHDHHDIRTFARLILKTPTIYFKDNTGPSRQCTLLTTHLTLNADTVLSSPSNYHERSVDFARQCPGQKFPVLGIENRHFEAVDRYHDRLKRAKTMDTICLCTLY